MLLCEARGNPNNGNGFKAGCVSQQLAEMRMIGSFQLVLNQHPTVGVEVLAKQVRAERANRPFLRLQLEIDIQRFC